uniref:GAG-pre-integrase domain-containing protein n=1 Tax=Cajanus cajan TaxID=3821 RepID=A0A151UF52_CAJCA
MKLHVKNVLYSFKSYRNLLSFKDIHLNGYYIETDNEKNVEYLYIMKLHLNKKKVLEKLFTFSYGLYCTYVNTIETHTIINLNFTSQNKFEVWYDRLGHPESIMMQKIIKNSHGHLLKSQEILQSNIFLCTSCSQGKLIIRPLPIKIGNDIILFLECM